MKAWIKIGLLRFGAGFRVWCFLGIFVSATSAMADPDAGFLFDQFPLTLSLGQRTEALGPFFYSETNSDGRETWAVPPLISRVSDKAAGFESIDFDRIGAPIFEEEPKCLF